MKNLIRLNKSQIKPAGKMFAKTFQDDPLFTYFIPNASERKNMAPYIFEFIIRYGVLYGEVYAISPNLEGVAGWLPSEKAKMTLWGMIRAGFSSFYSLYSKVGKDVISRMRSFDKYVSSIHKRHTPFSHWLLSFIGVDPMFQGKGYASTLLKAMFARIDQEHLPCYLETQNEKNVPLYQHYGFKVVEEVIIPGTKTSHWAMLREKSI